MPSKESWLISQILFKDFLKKTFTLYYDNVMDHIDEIIWVLEEAKETTEF
jgi:hypothetical protein